MARTCELGLLAALAAGGAGCLPGRDNPNDPANVPDASLVIAPIEGSPHTLFELTVVTSAGATLQFDLDGDGSFETAGTSPLVTELPLAAGAFGGTGVGQIERTVRVRVEHGGSSAEASAGVVLHNAAPILDPGPSTLVVSAWERPPVRLDVCGEVEPCPSMDPDGAAGVSFSWRQVRGTPVLAGIVTSGLATFLAPAEPETLLFIATADDGFASVTTPLEVQIGHPAWVSTSNPLRVYRLHTGSNLRALPADLGSFEAVWVDRANGDVWLGATEILAGPDETEVARVDAAGRILGRWPFPSDTTGIVSAFGSASGGWALRQSSATFEREVFRLQPIALGTAGTANFVTMPFEPLQLLPDPIDPGGAVAVGNQALARLDAGGGVTAVPGLGAVSPLFAAVANDGAIWTAQGFLDTTVSRLLLDGTIEDVTIPGRASAALVPGIDGVLVVFSTTAATVASIAAVDSTMQVEELAAPPIPVSYSSASAGGNGEVWNVAGPELTARRLAVRGGRWEVVAEGGLENLGFSDVLTASVADPWGGGILVTSVGAAPGETAFARVPANLSPFEQAIVSYGSASSASSTEPARGSLWVPGGFVGHVVRQDAGGRILADAELPSNASAAFGLLDGGVAVAWGSPFGESGTDVRDGDGALLSRTSLPSTFVPTQVSATGDGSVLCVAGFLSPDNVAYRIAGGAASLIATDVLDEIEIVASPNGACWTIDNSSLRRTGAAGAIDFGGGVLSIAADPFGDGVWVTYDDGGLPPLAVGWIDDSGSLLATFELPGGPAGVVRVTRACATAPAMAPACREVWVPIGSQTVSRFAGDGAGTALDSWILPAGDLTDLVVR